jgi:hypothetical protein
MLVKLEPVNPFTVHRDQLIPFELFTIETWFPALPEFSTIPPIAINILLSKIFFQIINSFIYLFIIIINKIFKINI